MIANILDGIVLGLQFGLLAAGLLIADRFGVSPTPADLAERYLIEGDSMRIITAAPPEAALYWLQDLGGFYYFFGVLAVWLVIVAFSRAAIMQKAGPPARRDHPRAERLPHHHV
ncbi:MAG: hypothetical protein HC933_10045 [Pleurocapsa sp. SU_196_0]|nr:hypothetical protein [Pleurocapsa sp. SU_196_0]